MEIPLNGFDSHFNAPRYVVYILENIFRLGDNWDFYSSFCCLVCFDKSVRRALIKKTPIRGLSFVYNRMHHLPKRAKIKGQHLINNFTNQKNPEDS